MPDYLSFLQTLKYIDLEALKASFNSPLISGTLIVGGIVLVFTFATYRRHLFHTSMSGAGLGFFVGVLLTLLIEGFLIYKYLGVSFFTSLLQKKPQDFISQSQTGPILGESTCTNPKDLADFFASLSAGEARTLKLSLCQEVLKEINK